MPFDGNGNWTSNFSAVADRDANIKILASRFDGILLADIASSFENCLTKDTQVKPTQNFNANNYRVINVADPSNDKDAVNKQTLTSSNALCVHLSGAETITGVKTFTNTLNINNGDGSVELNPRSLTTTGGHIDFHYAGSSSDYTSRIIEDGDGQLSIKGNRLMVPDSETAGSAIATKAISKGENGYVKLGNGIIIQWGRWSDSTDPSITFPTAFSNTNYSITTNDQRNTTNANANVYENKTNTVVKIHSQQTNGNWIAIGY